MFPTNLFTPLLNLFCGELVFWKLHAFKSRKMPFYVYWQKWQLQRSWSFKYHSRWKFNFKSHIKYNCTKAAQNPSALLKISLHIDTDKRILVYKSMIISQFVYSSLVWIFCFKLSNNLINEVHWRALKSIYQVNNSFEILLEGSRVLNSPKKMMFLKISQNLQWNTSARSSF